MKTLLIFVSDELASFEKEWRILSDENKMKCAGHFRFVDGIHKKQKYMLISSKRIRN